MENHIQVEETSTLGYGPPCFTKDKQLEKSFKRGHSPK